MISTETIVYFIINNLMEQYILILVRFYLVLSGGLILISLEAVNRIRNHHNKFFEESIESQWYLKNNNRMLLSEMG